MECQLASRPLHYAPSTHMPSDFLLHGSPSGKQAASLPSSLPLMWMGKETKPKTETNQTRARCHLLDIGEGKCQALTLTLAPMTPKLDLFKQNIYTSVLELHAFIFGESCQKRLLCRRSTYSSSARDVNELHTLVFVEKFKWLPSLRVGLRLAPRRSWCAVSTEEECGDDQDEVSLIDINTKGSLSLSLSSYRWVPEDANTYIICCIINV
jgi:hypothetical protein